MDEAAADDPFDTALDRAWAEHADDPAGVAARLEAQVLPLVTDDDRSMRFAALAHHLHGEHLGRFDEGIALLARLAAAHPPGAAAAASIARCRAALAIAKAAPADTACDPRTAMSTSDAARVTAMAAAGVCRWDAPRAAALLREAAGRTAAMPDDEPAVRALAANANNAAGTLQEAAEAAAPGAAERAPAVLAAMLDAAAIARAAWQRAGGWIEVERAEYRLALCHLAAGDAARALAHAEACAAGVRAHGGDALEAFFAGEALARTHAALGHAAAARGAVEEAALAFERIAEADRGWCRPTLERLRALAAAGA
jgi:hypothetical protein